jgi:hypothetical protein
MSQLTLATTRPYFGFVNSNDYVVLNSGRVIGRIMLHPQAPEGHPWFWSITAMEKPPSVYNKGLLSDPRTSDGRFKARWLNH